MNQASWVGVIKGLGVDIPIRMNPAAKERNIELHNICLQHGSRVEQTWQCHANGETVEPEHLGSAFIRDEIDGSLIVISTEDREALGVGVDRPQVIEITETRHLHAFDPEWVRRSYWAWSDRIAARAMASLWRALDREQSVALGTIVIQQRLYPVALRAVAHGKGEDRARLLSVMRLYWPAEVRVAPQATIMEAEPIETGAFREALTALDRSERPMLEGARNPHYDKLEGLITEREEADRKRQLERFA